LNTPANSLNEHLENSLNFFNNRNTNANAAAFNAKIKRFSANQRGVDDIKFFHFRMEELFSQTPQYTAAPLNATFIDEPWLLHVSYRYNP
jgi:hypothetical protein